MPDDLRRFAYDPHAHSDPGCKWPRCGRASDGSLDGEPYCLEHVERVVDRWVAVSLFPEQAHLLPDLFDC